ncbi:hypothetical protein PHYBOEH_004276 [Phytophthora boehmeriae]|uniref:Crinkler (CRN) family protein n=1 Tax=Phytophthora boehmeriae TaxID=109152 RepID=A0A8T1WTL6_9STRA|nr:hypothetical protein PHYBOEH_004276 [Phytophthora boehmeriae]
MAKEVCVQLVDEEGKDFEGVRATLFVLDGTETVENFLMAVHEKWQDKIAVNYYDLDVFVSQAAFEAREPIHPLEYFNSLAEQVDERSTILVEVSRQEEFTFYMSPEAQVEVLVRHFQWNRPKPLCHGPGRDWPYQGASEIANRLMRPLVEHYEMWQQNETFRLYHALNLVLGGAGTGKSRMLDKMKRLLCLAAERSKREDLAKRLRKAYVFKISFGGDSGSLLQTEDAEFDITHRMVHQLSKDNKSWPEFAAEMKEFPHFLPRIETVIKALAQMENVDPKDMTVILCVDDLQNLAFDHDQDHSLASDLSRVMAPICRFQVTSPAFVICVCSNWYVSNSVRDSKFFSASGHTTPAAVKWP